MLELIVGALAAGAAEAAKPTAALAIKEAYNGLKTVIVRKFGDTEAAIKVLEKKPESPNSKGSVEEAVKDSKADKDAEIIALAKTLAEAVKQHRGTGRQINTEGGAYVEGKVTISGDGNFIGRDHHGDIVHGDKFSGDKVMGNKIDKQINYVSTAPELADIGADGRKLAPLLSQYFNLAEIEALCFEMGIDDENLRGQTKDEKARSLIKHCEQRDDLDRLKSLMRVQRPKLRGQLI